MNELPGTEKHVNELVDGGIRFHQLWLPNRIDTPHICIIPTTNYSALFVVECFWKKKL